MDQEKSSKGSAGRKVYTEEFRRSVVDHLISSGKSVAQVAKEFGINPWNLRDWKGRYGPTAVPPKKWTLFRGSERRKLWIKKRVQRDLQGERFIPKSSGAR